MGRRSVCLGFSSAAFGRKAGLPVFIPLLPLLLQLLVASLSTVRTR